MFWLPAPGGGWVLQPTTPVLQGCVITAGTPRGFGFTNSVRAFTAAAAVLALLWLYAFGHAIEVIGAVLAAVLIEATTKPIKKTVHTLRKVLSPAPSGGGR
ncbi:hypothetical protein OG592_42805 (plasmid) [Streptomyces avidinii]|uniref:hypothetical protein n=1 Tax=Streptomyces avidinii TaxID=1895 RepID=UPI00386616C1|nr:hypothetical protein OG592_40840 [Streptomyces avidinii]WST50953.1 hypothetical protein OG592_42805 [Streptomyces avidinii]